MTGKVLHQVLETVMPGDATSDHAFLIRKWLRELGFESDIYAASRHESLRREVRRFAPGKIPEQDLTIFHLSIGSLALQQLIDQETPLLLIYHNITPPDFYQSADPELAKQLEFGREQLRSARPNVKLALGGSPYSEEELIATGFEKTGVLPIVLNEADYDIVAEGQLQEKIQNSDPFILFVGRVVPNKCQEDLLKLLYHVRKIEPRMRLVLVGGHQAHGYVRWLRYFARKYCLEEAVDFAGHVTQEVMISYYRSAAMFVSMSEHEGFGKPLIESMYFKLPIMAYAAAAVPSTLGGAGVLFTDKDYEALAEMVSLAINDQHLRQRLVSGQTNRVQSFLESNVRLQWQSYLTELGFLN